jgi:hypothetical protein
VYFDFITSTTSTQSQHHSEIAINLFFNSSDRALELTIGFSQYEFSFHFTQLSVYHVFLVAAKEFCKFSIFLSPDFCFFLFKQFCKTDVIQSFLIKSEAIQLI